MDQHETVNLKPLITAPQIQERIDHLVEEIAGDSQGNELIVIGLLKGCFMFLSDLVRQMHQHSISIRIDFMHVSSYERGTESTGRVKLDHDITTDIENRPVLLIDAILDTGHTLNFAYHHLMGKKPAVLKSCVLLDKPTRRLIPFQPDYTGFTVPNAFLVGYGLDYNGQYRQLPYISILTTDKENQNQDKQMNRHE